MTHWLEVWRELGGKDSGADFCWNDCATRAVVMVDFKSKADIGRANLWLQHLTFALEWLLQYREACRRSWNSPESFLETCRGSNSVEYG